MAEQNGKFGDLYGNPIELNELMFTLANVQPNDLIYNPFAGLASFGVLSDNQYIGQEINSYVHTLGLLRLLAHGKTQNARLSSGDSIEHWNLEGKADVIISSPPFGFRLRSDNDFPQINIFRGTIRTCEDYLIARGLESLNSNGRLVGIFAQNFLFLSHNRELRRMFVESDVLDMVISMPNRIFAATGINTSIVVLNKGKKKKGVVTFIDATSFYTADSKGQKTLKVPDLLSEINKANGSTFVREVSLETIREAEYNLSVNRYFISDLEVGNNEKLAMLQELLSSENGGRVSSKKEGYVISPKNLIDGNNYDTRLKLSQKEALKADLQYRKIDKSVLLVSRIGLKLKPTFFEYQGEPIFINPNLLAFKVKEDMIDIAYLINELNIEYFQKQIEVFALGAVIASIAKSDFLKTKVKVLSLKEQKAKVKGLKEAEVRLKIAETEK